MKSKTQTIVFWMIVGLSILFLLNLWNTPTRAVVEEEIMFSDFMAKLDQGAVEKVTMQGHRLTGVLKDNSQVRTYMADYPDLVQMLREKHVQIEVRPQGESAWYVTVLMTWGPFLLFLGVWLFIMRRMQNGNAALSLVKNRARMLTDERKKVTFSDVAGIDEVKADVQETVEFLKDPRKFQKLGGRIPKGVLVVLSP